MAHVICGQWDGSRFCKNTEFIIHSSESMQCSKCGHLFESEEVKKYNFAKEYSRDKQERILESIIQAEEAKLIATLYASPTSVVYCKEIKFRYSSEGYGDDLNKIWTWVDFYLTKDNKPIVAYYLTLDSHSGSSDKVKPEGDILLISNELPTFTPLHGNASTTINVPVQNPDKLVFTGATVGGITTGGFHTQSGGYHLEQITITGDYSRHVLCEAGRFGSDKLKFKIWPSELIVYESANIPGRLLKKSSEINGNSYKKRYKHIIEPDINNAISLWRFEDAEFKQIIFGNAPSDEELYKKACALMEDDIYQSQIEAVKLFEELGDYKDSQYKKSICEKNANQLKDEMYKEGTFKDKLIGAAFFIGIVLLFFIIAWLTT